LRYSFWPFRLLRSPTLFFYEPFLAWLRLSLSSRRPTQRSLIFSIPTFLFDHSMWCDLPVRCLLLLAGQFSHALPPIEVPFFLSTIFFFSFRHLLKLFLDIFVAAQTPANFARSPFFCHPLGSASTCRRLKSLVESSPPIVRYPFTFAIVPSARCPLYFSGDFFIPVFCSLVAHLAALGIADLSVLTP